MKRTLLTAALTGCLLLPGLALPIDAFPPDPTGATVEDRLYEEFEVGEKTYPIYAVMYAAGEHESKVDIYSGTEHAEGREWKKLYTWDVPKGPDKVNVLNAYSADDSIGFSVSSWFKYVEARAVPSLRYDPVSGKFDATLED